MRLSILMDQMGSGVGGGRFTTGFIKSLLFDEKRQTQISLQLLATQSESIEVLGELPQGVYPIRRRFPSRLRHTRAASLLSKTLPNADVGHGLFYYVFPSQARRNVITVHDLSFLNESYHPPSSCQRKRTALERTLEWCHAVVCISDCQLAEFAETFPAYKGKCVRIYNGTEPFVSRAAGVVCPQRTVQRDGILVVGTVEPRKNYGVILDAYEALLSRHGEDTPVLVIVGRAGWMCDDVVRRLTSLEAAGRIRWLRQATDSQLQDCYQRAAVFTYLSTYEGFGYPPFEAAYAEIPMVLSDRSAVGEIWAGYACCVAPSHVGKIVDAWEWALALEGTVREAVVQKQRKRAEEFTWERCVHSYIELYSELGES